MEARAASALDKVNLVTVFNAGEERARRPRADDTRPARYNLRMRALLLLSVSLAAWAASAQDAPRVAMDTLLNQRFYPGSEKGRFMVEKLHIVFPPATAAKGKVVLSKAGKTVSSVNVVSEVFPENGLKAFGQVVPDIGANPFLDAEGPGDYTMSVELGGKAIGAYSFKLEQGTSADPFAPKQGFRRTGPWSKTAIIVNPIERPGEKLMAWVWLSARELPGYKAGERVPFNVVVLRSGREVAYGPLMAATDEDWTPFRIDLAHDKPAVKNAALTYADLVMTPGDYSLAVKVRGAVAKEFKFRVANGAIVRIPQNELSYTGLDALSPQGTFGSRRVEHFWTAAIQ